MKITAIKQQQKRPHRYSIYVDNEYICSFSEGELLKLGLHTGQELTIEEVRTLKQDSIRDKAYMRAIDLISRRLRSRWELQDYLRRKEYPPELIELILNMLSKKGYVDDLEFARRWVENRRLLKPTSKRRLIQELRQKRIADDIIQSVFESDETNERDVLRELIMRKKRQSKYQDELKLKQYLARQGFGYDDIQAVLRETED
jgi:regulatory protein